MAVKRVSLKGVTVRSCEAMGSISRRAPVSISPRNPRLMTRKEFRFWVPLCVFFFFISISSGKYYKSGPFPDLRGSMFTISYYTIMLWNIQALSGEVPDGSRKAHPSLKEG